MRVPDEGVNDHNYRERCEEVSATGPANVDTAYNRVMNKYRFQSPEEHAKVKYALPGFNHARVPGVRYDISSSVDYPGHPEIYFHVDLTLMKSESGSGTSVRAKYCTATSDLKPNPYFNDPAFWSNVAAGFKSLVR